MSSSIFYKFKSQKDPQQITFDGTSLTVFEVKREIIALSRLGDGKDFDLEIYTPEAMEVYDDDTTQIPRSTTVIARRLPAQKPGAGRAARYVTGKAPVMAKNQHRIESAPSAGKSSAVGGVMNGGQEQTEEEKLQAILAAGTESWKADQAQMQQKPFVRSTFNKSSVVPDKPLPPGYTCFRCGEKGHWIQACPTNNDPNWDGRQKFKKTTGIPRSMLRTIEKTELGPDGKPDLSKVPAGVMITATGEWVVSEPDKVAWDKFQEKQNAAAEKSKEAAADNEELRERGLECPMDKHIFSDPVKTPCCGKIYCRDCIENALLDGDLLCPNCGEQVLLDKLEPDEETSKKTKEYKEEKKAQKELKEKEAATKSPVASPKAETPKAEENEGSAQSPKAEAATSAASTPVSRKRSADGELENNRKPAPPSEQSKSATPSAPAIPTGPKAMQQQQANMPQNMTMQTPSNMQEFVSQMNALAPGAGNGMMPGGMMNPMMGMMNPMMGGMPGMPGMMNPMMGMPGFGNGMGGMNGMNGMNMGGFNNGMGNQGWQQNWNNQNGGGMMPNNNNGNGAYFRQPVNQNRQQGRQKRQRSVDYKQV